MSLNYKDRYYNHFEKRDGKNPPKFEKDKNYMMRFDAPLSHFKFEDNNLTIIYFKDGVGELQWKNKRIKVEANKFIVTNPSMGWEYVNERQDYIDVLSLVICDALREQFNYFVSTSQVRLLDNPFHSISNQTYFMEQMFGANYYRSGWLLQSIYRLSNNIDYAQTCPEELSIDVLQTIYNDQYRGYGLATHIASKKPSTKLETLKRLLRANEYIQDNLMNPISLDELSRVSTLSKYHLYNSFKLVYGKTPHQYINSLKIKKAQKILQNQKLSVSEVSDLFGFSDLAVFSKLFKKVYGKPPSYYLLSK